MILYALIPQELARRRSTARAIALASATTSQVAAYFTDAAHSADEMRRIGLICSRGDGGRGLGLIDIYATRSTRGAIGRDGLVREHWA